MITLYGTPRSRSLRVSWTLEELGVPWSYQNIKPNLNELVQSEFIAINPAGKVPVIRDNQLLLSESVAICHYLAEKYGQGTLLPKAATPQSAQHQRWLSFILNEMDPALRTQTQHTSALPEDQRIPELLPLAKQDFNNACIEACHWLNDGPYLLGETFTIADIVLTHTLNWAMVLRQQLPAALNVYRKQLSQRPALARALEKELSDNSPH